MIEPRQFEPWSENGRSWASLLGSAWVANNPSDIVNVADLGAKGDGVTDDFFAIQTALNAVFSHPKYQRVLGTHVYFPGPDLTLKPTPRTGIYRVSSPLTVPGWGAYAAYTPNYSNVTISLHPAATISFEHSGTAPRALFELGTGCSSGSLRFEGGRHTGKQLDSKGPAHHGIWIGIGNVTLRDMMIDGFPGDGVYIDSSLGGQVSTDVGSSPIVNRIENCRILGNSDCGIFGPQATAIVVERCRIENNNKWGVRLRGNGMSVHGNTIEGNGSVDKIGNLLIEALTAGVIDASVTNNYFHGNYNQKSPMLSIQGNKAASVARVYAAGNYFVGNEVPSSCAVDMGTLDATDDKGNSIVTVRNATIIGNNFVGFQTGVLVGRGTDRFLVGPNSFIGGLKHAIETVVSPQIPKGRAGQVFKWPLV